LSALDDEMLGLLQFAAERSIMPRWRNLRPDQVEDKAADDPVTVADREVEQFLTEALTRLAPGVNVVGEEAAHADPAVLDALSGPCWIIDPIDGTGNFAAGEGHFATMVALADAGEAIAAWIYDPQRRRMCRARRSEGAFIDEQRVRASASGDEPPRLAAMKRYMPPERRALFEDRIAPHYQLVGAPGCAAEQYPLVALGEHDIAIYERVLAWDHAAGCLFLNEAGGRCSRQDGSSYRVDSGRKGLIAAGDPGHWDNFVERLNRAGYAPDY
jgi:fructose-1,6-bisphosphatase/inositol monophosphatase family enzyme